MKKLLVVALLIAVTIINAAENKYGKEITLTKKTSISKILASPNTFEGKTVLVEGNILGVCQEKGCWIEVAGAKAGEKIKVKVEDGVIVFPKDVKGKKAIVEGTLVEVKAGEGCEGHDEEAKNEKMSKDEKKEGCGKEGEEATSCCGGGEKTAKVYQIKGLGAVIK
jgi:hypothetical protein